MSNTFEQYKNVKKVHKKGENPETIVKEKIVEVPVEVPVEKEVIKEVIKEVPVETIKEVVKEVPVEKIVYRDPPPPKVKREYVKVNTLDMKWIYLPASLVAAGLLLWLGGKWVAAQTFEARVITEEVTKEVPVEKEVVKWKTKYKTKWKTKYKTKWKTNKSDRILRENLATAYARIDKLNHRVKVAELRPGSCRFKHRIHIIDRRR